MNIASNPPVIGTPVAIGVTAKDAAEAAEQAVYYGITKPLAESIIKQERDTMTIDEAFDGWVE